MKIWIDDQCFEHDDNRLKEWLEHPFYCCHVTKWDDEFDGLEPENFDDIQTVVDFLEENDKDDDICNAYIAWCKNDYKCTYDVDKFREAYCGTYETTGDFAYELARDTCMINEDFPNYFDSDAFWNDLECGGDYYALGCNDQYIFRTM